MKKTTPTQIVYESGQRRRAKLAQLEKSAKKISADYKKKKMAQRDRHEQAKVKKKIDALDRKEQGKKPKKQAIKKLTKTQVLDVLQLLAKVRDAGTDGLIQCISCPSILPLCQQMTGGHYQGRQLNSTAFDMDNIHGQCSTCNGHMHNGGVNGDRTKAKYRENLIAKIGHIGIHMLEDKIKETLHKPTKVPDQWELKQMMEQAELQILKHIKGKNIEPNPLLAKIIRKHAKAQDR